MEYLKFIGLGFLALFAFYTVDSMISDWERWHAVFLIVTLMSAIIDYLIFAFIPLSVIYAFRESDIIFAVIACIGIAIWVFVSGMFYVALSGMQTLQLGQSFHIQDGQMMPALYISKLWLVLAIYAVLEVWMRLGKFRHQRAERRST